MKGLLFAYGFLATMASAHIQMIEPVPIRSPESKDKSGKIDYSYTNPLSDDGKDYPCKGYADDPFNSVANYSPGQKYNLKLKGSATHDGGSCQISLSYDKGKNFKVIHSMLGGCPLTKEYEFQIPEGAPSGQALLAWTWFNKVGNREMYMNCAQVTIGGGGGGKKRGMNEEKSIARRDGFNSLPPMFIANVQGPGKCKTIEGQDVNFPLPGPSVEGKATGKGYKCEGSAPFLGDGGGGGGGGSDSGDSSKAPNWPSDSSNDNSNSDEPNSSPEPDGPDQEAKPSEETEHKELLNKVAKPFGDTNTDKDSNLRTASAGTRNSPSWVAESKGCKGNGLVCAPDGKTFALCNEGEPIYMGDVAGGTECVHGAIQHATKQSAT
ncbi:hypothetical protein BDV59DRAFT_203461 [Aspergillus ambiguus]|uniref:putative extracellular protein n=1 Tax=Aspergillus ambiguus TaxID=176160 RepID=UPI003CCE45CC